MIVDRKWVERNIGFDPVERPAPASTFAFKAAASSADTEDLRREIIDFDSDATEGLKFLAFTKFRAVAIHRYSMAERPGA